MTGSQGELRSIRLTPRPKTVSRLVGTARVHSNAVADSKDGSLFQPPSAVLRLGVHVLAVAVAVCSGMVAYAQDPVDSGPSFSATRAVTDARVTAAQSAGLEFEFSENPAPVSSTPCEGISPAWVFGVTITATGNVGLTIESAVIVLLNSAGNPVASVPIDFRTRFGTEGIAPGASVSADFCVHRGGANSGFARVELVGRNALGNTNRFFSSQLPLADAPSETGRPRHGFVAVNGAFQLTETTFNERLESTFNAETALENRDYVVEPGEMFDISAGLFVWRNLAIGGGVSRFTKTGNVDISGSLPHPFFFNRSRSVTGSASDVGREELVIYANAVVLVPVNDKLTIAVFGGPAFFTVKQDLVSETFVNDAFPFTSVSVASVQLNERSESQIGFNVGADVAVYFSRYVGVGGLLRFSRATVSLPSDGASIDVDAGGLQVGAGLRLRF